MKFIKLFEEHYNKPINTNNWKYKLKIKNILSDVDLSLPTDENKREIIKICKVIVLQLNKLENNTEKSNLKDDEKDAVLRELEELKDHFNFVIELADDTIPEKDWHEFSFDGNFQELSNDYLSLLYDLGDTRVINKNNESEKYFFVV